MTAQQIVQDKQWSRIVARAWADESFKTLLLSNPDRVLREYGLEVAEGAKVRVVEGDAEETSGEIQFVLPPSPSAQLSEEELGSVAVMYCYSGFSGRCGRCGCGCGCRHCGCAL